MNSPTFTELRERLAEGVPPGQCDEIGVRRLWRAALDTLQQELIRLNVTQGMWLAAPLPALHEPQLLQHLQGWVWAPEHLNRLKRRIIALPDHLGGNKTVRAQAQGGSLLNYQCLALLPDDGHDPVLMVITPTLQVVVALHGEPQQRQLLMRCDPASLGEVLAFLERRLEEQSPKQAEQLHIALESLGPLHSDKQLNERFWSTLAERLAVSEPESIIRPAMPPKVKLQNGSDDLDLLEALTHEVRTPLATIRTLIRSLLRRKDLPDLAIQRLQQIDVECNEQIDRFGLIFHAAELQRQPTETILARTNLESILEALALAWSEQLKRRGIRLILDLDHNLPAVLSDSRRLEAMLGGLIDRSSRGLPTGSKLKLGLQAAGLRVKLQLHVVLPNSIKNTPTSASTREKLGTLLSWDPTTGSLQLSQDATRRMMASLGGHYRPRRDRDLTVFFPIDGNSD
ncbi:sensor histidine kinase [Synechococcus sp. M16CYN]|uniref:sensor histidine kinase n=1 Tax=Synechococcus sp. M16CYN TaxID=3103139 RepID=UPI00324D3822